VARFAAEVLVGFASRFALEAVRTQALRDWRISRELVGVFRNRNHLAYCHASEAHRAATRMAATALEGFVSIFP